MANDNGDSFAEYRRKRDREEIDKSFDAFEDDLTREEYGAAVNDLQEGLPLSAEGASVGFSNEKRKAAEVHSERSQRARASDESQRATLTTNYEEWESNPANFDFPGVDTPSDADISSLFD